MVHEAPTNPFPYDTDFGRGFIALRTEPSRVPTRRLLVVVAVVALAGCAGLGTAPGPTPTITPAPVPEGTPTPFTPTPSALAPGVTTGGVSNPDRLADAHRSALANRSYTVVVRTSVVGLAGENWTGYEPRREGDGVFLHGTRRVVRVNAGGYPRSVVRAVEGRLVGELPIEPGTDRGTVATPATAEIWSDGQRSYRRVVGNGTVAYATIDGDSSTATTVPLDPTAMELLRPWFGAVPSWATYMSSAERRAVVLGRATAVGLNGSVGTAATVTEARDVVLTARVAPSGLVLEFELRYVGTLDGRSVEVRLDVEVLDLDTTTVGRPTWVETARNESRSGRAGPGRL